MASNLPPEILESVLLKLPVKSLLRFRSVSKSWNAIVSDPIFVRNHHDRNSKSQTLFLRKRSYTPDCGLSLVKLEHEKLQTTKKLELPYGYDEYNHAMCCFCEYGVLLLTDFSFNRCLLWNPYTRTTTQLSLPYNGAKCSGLCYDPAIDDFKVVFLYPDFYLVYSCKTKSWSERKQHSHANISSFRPGYNSSGVSINGAIYWLVWGNYNYIVYYDARDDKLKILQKPEDVEDHMSSFLVDLGGHLCLYNYYGNIRTVTIRIWRKGKGVDENSWKELITIHNVDRRIWSLEPLCFVGNKIVMQYEDYDKLLVYDPLDRTFEQVEERLIGIRSLIPYRETLYILT